ncbi:MAG: hypothetical protein VZR10_09660 [Methanobrevibacter sp.]|nr:hypothetical protein [Methanobrevibacter sp.]
MKAEDIIIGKKVYYHPIIGGADKKEVTITSEVFEIGCTPCCMVDSVSGCVAIEALTEM